MTAQTSYKWTTISINGYNGEFSNDLRGGKQTDSSYDILFEIEADAKNIRCSSMFTGISRFESDSSGSVS